MNAQKLLLGGVTVGVLALVFLLSFLVGSGKKEIGQLRSKTTTLETELASTRMQLDDVRKEFDAARTKDQRGEAKEEALTNELVKVKVERDKLKQELTALKRKH